MKNKIKSKGFTLIEVLISLLIFAFGMLGITMQMSKSMSSTINNEVHSSVMQLAMQSIEPLNNAVLQSREDFKIDLNNLANLGLTPAFTTNNSQLNRFEINVENAVDSNKNPLRTSNTNSWAPPYSITLRIDYFGRENNILSFYTTHVLVPAENPS